MSNKIKTTLKLAAIYYAILFAVDLGICIILSLFLEMSIAEAIWLAIEFTPKAYLLFVLISLIAGVVIALIKIMESVGNNYEKDN